MKLLKRSILIGILLITSISSAQTIRSANKLFNKLSYKQVAKEYTGIYNRGERSYKIISRIADSYYFNTDTKNSEKWYSILSGKYPNKLKQEHLFRYVHSLQGNKKYEQANKKIKEFSSAASNEKLVANLLENPEYFIDFKNSKYEFNSFDNIGINTKFSDFGGFVYKDKLYFASTTPGVYKRIYKWNEQPFLNIYTGSIKEIKEYKITVETSKLMESPIRTKFHESNPIITKDGKTMYFTRDNYYKGKKRKSTDQHIRLKLYRASLVKGKWGEIVELPFNSDEYSVGHSVLSPDERTLYFISDRPGGYGATDIYKVAIKENNTYGAVINLGSTINTEKREMFPYVSSDNTLYFASNGHLGLGGLDIFQSEITKGKYGKVENMRYPFNSGLDDFAFYIDSDNRQGFVSSNREGGKGDDEIYSFRLKTVKRRSDYNCNKTVRGVVTNKKTGEILANATVRIHDEKAKLLKEVKSDEKGGFSFLINCLSKRYKLKGTKENFIEDLEEVVTGDLKTGDIIKLELEPIIVLPVVVDVVEDVVIHPIYFNFNKSGVREGDSRPELDEIIKVMNLHPDLVIGIESHTDSRGTYSYNIGLSQSRVNSTKKYLLSKGIKASRIAYAKGLGEGQLLNDCDNKTKCTEKEHQLNRRSYFIVVSGGKVKVDNIPPTIVDKKKGFE